MTTKPLGYVLYYGPSRIDNGRIVAIATGYHKSRIQVFIMRSDIPPHEAVHTGQDASICGGCPGRGLDGLGRSCYVRVEQAPLSVWRAYHRGQYKLALPEERAGIGRGRIIRLGAYGDPCAVPMSVWSDFLSLAAGWTGYTHQWRNTRNQPYRHFLMASCENYDHAQLAQAKGWRTFRVRCTGDAVLMPAERQCPAVDGSTTCAECRGCNGKAGAMGNRGYSIEVHGVAGKVKAFCRRNQLT